MLLGDVAGDFVAAALVSSTLACISLVWAVTRPVSVSRLLAMSLTASMTASRSSSRTANASSWCARAVRSPPLISSAVAVISVTRSAVLSRSVTISVWSTTTSMTPISSSPSYSGVAEKSMCFSSPWRSTIVLVSPYRLQDGSRCSTPNSRWARSGSCNTLSASVSARRHPGRSARRRVRGRVRPRVRRQSDRRVHCSTR